MRALRITLLLLAVLLSCQPSSAQSPAGSIHGRVSASTGLTLPGVTVSISNPAAGIERQVVTDANGEYSAGDLPVGSYDIVAELDGFAPARRSGIVLAAGASETVSFLLMLAHSETVSVIGQTATLEQQRAILQRTIPESLAHSLPLIGRDFIALAMLTPGFTGNPIAPSPNGQVYWSNNLLVDGASHYSKWRSAARAFYSGYSLEAIQQVQVLSSQFSPEYGEALAAVTTAVTRSGSNERHGTLLFFGQSGVLNDQPVFAAEKPPSASGRLGLTMGGPIARDRTFYFASYEGRISRSNNFVVSPAAPNATVANDEDEHLAFAKVDRRIGPADLVTARYNGQWFTWHNENGGLWLPGSGTKYRNDVNTAGVTATQLVSDRALNQARFQFARYTDRRTDLHPVVYVSRAGYSLEGGTLGPYGFGATPEDTWEGADTLMRTDGAHALKFGGGLRYTRAHNESLPFGYGAYYFAGDPVRFPQPYAFVQGIARSADGIAVNPRSLSSFLFAQDEWRAAPQLTVGYGLRYDIEQVYNVSGYTAPADRNNVQPRASATWVPFGGRFSVRAGAGLYTQQHLLHYINRAQLEGPDGTALVTLTPESPLMPAYPAIVDATVLSHIPRDVYVVDSRFRNPYSVQASAGVAHHLFGLDVSADYVYLSGQDLMSIVDANAPASVGKPASRTVAEADATRPLVPVAGGFRKVITLGNQGRSWYHAVQFRADRSMGALTLLSSYTLARARDMANYVLPEDSRNLDAEKARSDNDIRHNVTAGLTWAIPSTTPVIGNCTLAAAGQFRSNRPYNVTWGDDRNGTTQNDARPGGRNTGQTGTYRNVDVALSRRLPLGSRTIELRVEAFNLLSTTNYDEYVGTLSSAYFGQPVSAFPKRRLQLAAIVRF